MELGYNHGIDKPSPEKRGKSEGGWDSECAAPAFCIKLQGTSGGRPCTLDQVWLCLVITWFPFSELYQLSRTKSYYGSMFLNCTLETSELWHSHISGYPHYINLLVLVIRKECQILLRMSSYQGVAIVFLSGVSLGKTVRQAEFMFGHSTSPYS